jgi:hypothetical protein
MKHAVTPSGDMVTSFLIPNRLRWAISGLPMVVSAIGSTAVAKAIAISEKRSTDKGLPILRMSGPIPLAAQLATM